MKLKKYKLEIEIPVCEDKKGTFSMRYNVKGMMTRIERAIETADDKKSLLEEYAKFSIMNQLGIEIYPEDK